MRATRPGPILALIVCCTMIPTAAKGQNSEPKAKTTAIDKTRNTAAKPASEMSPSQAQNQPPNRENTSQSPRKERPPFWKDAAASNWALVIVGSVAAIIAIGTLKKISRQTAATERAVAAAEKSAVAADSTLRIMKDTAERQLRAYVLPVGGGRVPDKHFPGRYIVTVKFKNTGQTPAFDCTSCLGVGISTFPIPNDLPDIRGAMGKSRFVLAPGEETDLGGIQNPITPQDLSQIEAGTLAIYVFGEFLYSDIFNINRYAKFRMFCNGEWFSKGKFQFPKEGNEAN